ncbi:hypothetical protein N7468_004627 [Penicillium chermesinum]|uniref:Uncharacterized protein n=1 Tax=Penicillium chermesinum TaxID=63820 RepID=A0A9W9TTD7_9EURO|nr:uncharacterized protein N7468_004627 [Penicillium chermesinum]KAJ5240008.1 hypothetical protein N7468_004627 [Penicillium chermesinum]KAJ6166885.1 hypothetical protein N7470_002332 [Penicillium chermesinum]
MIYKLRDEQADNIPRGCVTPLVVATITQEWVEASNGPVNPDLLEGWDELTEDEQAKVIRAIMNGRVDDTDWRGDPEMNVIGAVGFRSKKSKTEAPPKKATGKKRARGASPTEEDGEPSSKSARRGRGRGRGGGRGSRGVCGDPKEAA